MDYTAGNIRQSNLLERLVRKKLFWILFCGFAFAFPLYRSFMRKLPPPPPVLSMLPQYRLMNEQGEEFGSRELQGRFYLANFIFTSCSTVCPQTFEALKKIRHRLRGLGDKVAIISFTVDPETDTPSVLLKKSRELGANSFLWRFLTGSRSDLEQLLIKGFKVPMGGRESHESNLYDIAHTQKVVLVDGKGQIRGYYGLDKATINQLMIDIGLLVNKNEYGDKRNG